MIRKGQVRNIARPDIKVRARFVATLFEVAPDRYVDPLWWIPPDSGKTLHQNPSLCSLRHRTTKSYL
jgi:hypothetical protein